jgi:hypothetical protein
MQVDQEYCINDYWCDYPRKDRVKIDETSLSAGEKQRVRRGETVSKSDRRGTYTQYFIPIKYNSIR